MRNNLCLLSQDEIPLQWYNIVPDLPNRIPVDIDTKNSEESKVKLMRRIRAKELTKQDDSTERFINIPSQVIEVV